MFFTGARLYWKKDWIKVIVFVVICMTVVLTGCSQSNVEAPLRGLNLWGFANKTKTRSNTFTENTVAVSDSTAYSYFDEEVFTGLVRKKLQQKEIGTYQPDYQEEAGKQIEKIKASNKYTMEYPLFVQNAFGTNACGLYVYMGKTKEQIHLYYTISSEDESIPDFSDTMYMNMAGSNAVEGQITGLVPGQYNKIVIELRDASGGRINQKAYLLYIPKNQSGFKNQTAIMKGVDRGNRGLFHVLSFNDENDGFYLFYDNNGILRGQIPTSVTNLDAKVLQIRNQLFYATSDNSFVLVDNLGRVIESYVDQEKFQIVDYDYDGVNHRMLFLTNIVAGNEGNCIIQLELENKQWSTQLNLTNLIHEDKNLLFCNLQVVEGKDIILCSKTYSSILRINNIYSSPVIRWILGEEQQWKRSFESLLLYEFGSKTKKISFDSVTQIHSKELKDGQLYLSLIDYNSNKTSKKLSLGKSSYYRKYFVDENQNRYRLLQQFEISPHTDHCSAVMYGKHIIISFEDEKEIVEYNEKGEIVLRMRFPNTISSYHIYKYSMDRYWF